MYPPSLPTTGPDNQGTSTIPAQKTYQDFIDHKTVTVEQVLEKGIAFGFREAHIHYGLEKKSRTPATIIPTVTLTLNKNQTYSSFHLKHKRINRKK